MTNNISETDKSNIFCNNNITVRIHKSNCLKSKVVLYDGHMAHYMSSSSDPINTDMHRMVLIQGYHTCTIASA